MAMIAAGIGAGVLVVAVVAGAVMALRGGGDVLPFEHGQLPTDTQMVVRWNSGAERAEQFGVAGDALPAQAQWSAMAELCGGYDVFEAMMGAPLKFGGRKYAARTLAKDIDELQLSLKCGKKLAESMTSPWRYAVLLADGKHTRRVRFVTGGPDKLPETAGHFKGAADPPHMLDTHCLILWTRERSDKCVSAARAVARIDGTDIWARGMLSSLEAFGDDFSPAGKNASSVSERLADLAAEFSDQRYVMVGDAGHFRTNYAGLFGASVGLSNSGETKDLKETVDDEGKAWALGITGERGARELELVIVTANESSAKEIKAALKDFHSALKDEIDDRQDKEDETDRDDDQEEKYLDYRAARRKMARRALKAAKITRDGKRVTLHAVEEAKKGELKTLARYASWRTKQLSLAAKVVDALLKGEEPRERVLEKLGGEAFVEAWEEAKAKAE